MRAECGRRTHQNSHMVVGGHPLAAVCTITIKSGDATCIICIFFAELQIVDVRNFVCTQSVWLASMGSTIAQFGDDARCGGWHSVAGQQLRRNAAMANPEKPKRKRREKGGGRGEGRGARGDEWGNDKDE
eukprot:GGOE01033552.1.p4 GENE.GGOE01033552.1~~GGOE01033552.1.p4  ORF type:complete len:130 (+),score=4.18 GGOE01033552.1:91-480(+)